VQDSVDAARPAGADKGIVLTLSLRAHRTLVKTLVELHGGTVKAFTAEARAGQGASSWCTCR
jgi:hypothetical protein